MACAGEKKVAKAKCRPVCRLAVAFFFFVVVLALLNGPALYRAADGMAFDSKARGPFLAVAKSLAGISRVLHIDCIRDTTERFERKHLE